MNAVSAIVISMFREMRRDRSAAMFLVLLPIGLMVLMGNIYEAADNPIPRLAVLVETPDTETDATVAWLRDSGGVELRPVEDQDVLDDQVRRRRVDAGIVLDAGHPAELVGAPDAALPGGVRFIVRSAVSRVSQAARLAEAIPGASLREVLVGLPEATSVPVAEPGEARTEAAIGILVLVVFMNLIAYGAIVPSHRSVGVLDRMGAAPVSRASLVAAYGTGFAAVALVQTCVALLAGRFLVGVAWGPTSQVLVVVAGLCVGAAGVAALASTLLATPESGSSIGGPAGFVLGMLGGCLWPLDFVGGVLQTVGRWIPHHWAIEALRSIAADGATVASVVPAAVGLMIVGVAAGALGARRLGRTWV